MQHYRGKHFRTARRSSLNILSLMTTVVSHYPSIYNSFAARGTLVSVVLLL